MVATKDYENSLLEGWEDIYKKSQLTLWIMLALKAGPKHMAEIKEFMQEATNGLLTADDKSMYRALRRFHDAEMVSFTSMPNDNGPDLKVYALTTIGSHVLRDFIKRNIAGVFYKPSIEKLLTRKGV